MSFVTRQITLSFELGQGTFGESGYDTVTLAGYRCMVQIERAALPNMSSATARIYGMPPSLMNQVSTLGNPPYVAGRRNQVTITAGDADAGVYQIFQGIINNGYQDYSAMPEVAFVVEAQCGSLNLTKPSAPSTHPGNVDAATVLQSLASQMTPPLAFNNSGVSVILSKPYLSGTLIDQIRSVVRAANINGEIHGNTLYIWPRNAARPVPVVTISPDNGLIGYPSFNGVQIIGMRTLFNPAIQFGQQVKVQSSLIGASGTWYVNQMAHILESVTPHGAWFTDLGVYSYQYLIGQPIN